MTPLKSWRGQQRPLTSHIYQRRLQLAFCLSSQIRDSENRHFAHGWMIEDHGLNLTAIHFSPPVTITSFWRSVEIALDVLITDRFSWIAANVRVNANCTALITVTCQLSNICSPNEV